MKNTIYLIWLIMTFMLCVTIAPMFFMVIFDADEKWFGIGSEIKK